MRKQAFEQLGEWLAPQLPGFAVKGPLLFARPIAHVLSAFYFEGSSFDKSRFTVWAFGLPLYVPTEHVYFNFGDRIRDDGGGEVWWDIGDPTVSARVLEALRGQGRRVLDDYDDPAKLARAASRSPQSINPRDWEVIAYSLVQQGDGPGALRALDRLAATVNAHLDWHRAILERAQQFKVALLQSVSDALRLLDIWEQETVRRLGLQDFWTASR